MNQVLSGIDSIVLFRNSQGRDGRGTLMHITRSNVVFEIYNPYSIVQISEVLQTVKILRGDRMIYHGRAVVNNIVTTGLMIIASATLIDPWSDLEGLTPGKGLRAETQRFVDDWKSSFHLRPEYQLVISTLRNFMGELSRWLEEAEAGVLGIDPARVHESPLAEEFYQEIQAPIAPKVIELFKQFETEAARVPDDQLAVHKAFARRELHPLTLCSPFVHRTYTKPLGYAGHYEMVNMMLGTSSAHVNSTYARIVDAFHVQTAAPEAHRNRIDMLQQRLQQEAERVVAEERPFTVLNVGCGPAVEIQRYVRQSDLADFTTFHLMDFNEDTLNHTQDKIEQAIQESGRRPTFQFIQKSIDELLKEAHRAETDMPSSYEMIYCAGLFDYFSTRICRQLCKLFFRWVRPGGLVAVTNVHPNNPNRYQMEHLLEWHLVYRDEADMKKLVPEGAKWSIEPDTTGVNLFLDLRKENAW